MSEPLLTTDDVAALLRVHPKHVYRLLRRGLPGHRVGSEWRFAREEVLRWVERGGLRRGEPDVAPAASPRPEGSEATTLSEAPARPDTADAAARAARLELPALVAANGDIAVEVLLAHVNALGPPLLGFVQADRDAALALLAAGQVLAAGCHAGLPPSHLGGARLARIHLVTREVGLAGRAGAPPPTLADLATLRLAARPPTAGVRAHLDAALHAAGVDPDTIRATSHASHRDALLAVLRGEADAALATCAWAARVGLPFRAIATEAYGLVVRAADLGDPRVVRLCEVAQRPAYRAALATVPGYDPAGAGDIRYDAGPAPG